MKSNRLNGDTITGASFAIFGAFVIWIGSDYEMGTAVQTGSGYFPHLLAWLCVGLSGILLLRGMWNGTPQLAQINLRSAAFLVAGILAFASTVDRFGLVVASASLVVLVSLARPSPQWGRIAVLAVVLAIFSAILFVELLGLPFSIGPRR